MAKLRVIQVRSVIGRPVRHKRTMAALGLGRPRQSRVHEDSASIRGMIFQVKHLVKVEPVEDDSAGR